MRGLQGRWGRHSDALAKDQGLGLLWLVFGALLLLYQWPYWLELRPGVFTDDSGMYLTQVMTGEVSNQKPYFFARFLQLISLDGRVMTRLALVMAIIGIALIARVLAIGWRSGAPWWLMALALALVINPYMPLMLLYVQNDVLFCIAATALVVETIWCVRMGRCSRVSIAVIALTAPAALLFRQNGLLLVPLWLASLPWVLTPGQWKRVAIPVVATCGLSLLTMVGVDRSDTLNTKFPAVAHAITALSRAERGQPVGVKISPQTRAIVGETRIALAPAYYDPRYWDFAGFYPGGPLFQLMSEADKDAVVKSFVKHDLWPNLPAIVAIRTQMFLNIVLGRSHPLGGHEIPRYLPDRVLEAKISNPKSNGWVSGWLDGLATRSLQSGSLPGLCILILLSLMGIWQRRWLLVWLTMLYWIQVAAVFLLMPAADSRYLFLLYLFPLAALGACQRIAPSTTATTTSET